MIYHPLRTKGSAYRGWSWNEPRWISASHSDIWHVWGFSYNDPAALSK